MFENLNKNLQKEKEYYDNINKMLVDKKSQDKDKELKQLYKEIEQEQEEIRNKKIKEFQKKHGKKDTDDAYRKLVHMFDKE